MLCLELRQIDHRTGFQPRTLVSTGVAAHIYAARPGGPRGSGGLSRAELAEPENGIWCCANHGRVIDSDNGALFSAADLLAWKRLHLSRKRAEVAGWSPDRFGFVESIAVRSAPGRIAGRDFELSMRNLITGSNGSGKSMLARLIAGASEPQHIVEVSRGREIDITVQWFDPRPRRATTRTSNGRTQITVDGEPKPYLTRAFKPILVSPEALQCGLGLPSLALMLDLSDYKLRAALEAMPERSTLVKEVRVERETFEATVELDGHQHRVTPEDPGGLAGFFLAELAAVHAGYNAEGEPTFLIVDEVLDMVHPSVAVGCIESVECSAGSAQMAVITHQPLLVDRYRAEWPVTVVGLPPVDKVSPRAPVTAEITTTAIVPEVGNSPPS